jgi:uncharacterized OB-fold protein
MSDHAAFPSPPVENHDLRFYWEGIRNHRLLYQKCRHCNEVIFHPRVLCPYCLSEDIEYQESAGKGEVYSFTIQYYGLSPYWKSKLPYALGIVAMKEGYHIFSEISPPDPAALKIGAPVEVWFDHVDAETVLPKFKLVSSR